MEVSIIIPVFNRSGTIGRILERLLSQEFPAGDCEIIVVDDGSADGKELKNIVDAVSKSSPFSIRLIRKENRGPAAARNTGTSHSLGMILAFLDADVTVGLDWLRNGVGCFTDEMVFAVEGIVRSPSGGPTGLFIHSNHSLPGGGSYMSGNIMYRRSAFEEAGGFDERFRRPWRDDSDLGYTVVERGGKVAFCPTMIGEHPDEERPWWFPLKDARKYSYDSLLYKKHRILYRKGIRRPIALTEYLFLASLAAAILAGIMGIKMVSLTLGITALISYGRVFIWRIARRKDKWWRYIVAFFVYAIEPAVRMFSVILGNIRYKTFLF